MVQFLGSIIFITVNCSLAIAADETEYHASLVLEDLEVLKSTVGKYYADQGQLPTKLQDLLKPSDGILGLDRYIPKNLFDLISVDPWGNPLRSSFNENFYVIWSLGPDTIDDTKDDIRIVGSIFNKKTLIDHPQLKPVSADVASELTRIMNLKKSGKNAQEIKKLLESEKGNAPLNEATITYLNSIESIENRMGNRALKAKKNVVRADINVNIEIALRLYKLDNNIFPTTQEGLDALFARPSTAKNWNGPYLNAKRFIIDPWENEYLYYYPSKTKGPDFYDLLSIGPDQQEGTDDDIVDHGKGK